MEIERFSKSGLVVSRKLWQQLSAACEGTSRNGGGRCSRRRRKGETKKEERKSGPEVWSEETTKCALFTPTPSETMSNLPTQKKPKQAIPHSRGPATQNHQLSLPYFPLHPQRQTFLSFPKKPKTVKSHAHVIASTKKCKKTNLTIPPPVPSPNQTADIRYSSSIAFPNSGQLRSARSAGPNVFRGKPPKEQLGAGVLPKPDLQTRLQSLLLRLETFVVLALSDLLQEGF